MLGKILSMLKRFVPHYLSLHQIFVISWIFQDSKISKDVSIDDVSLCTLSWLTNNWYTNIFNSVTLNIQTYKLSRKAFTLSLHVQASMYIITHGWWAISSGLLTDRLIVFIQVTITVLVYWRIVIVFIQVTITVLVYWYELSYEWMTISMTYRRVIITALDPRQATWMGITLALRQID